MSYLPDKDYAQMALNAAKMNLTHTEEMWNKFIKSAEAERHRYNYSNKSKDDEDKLNSVLVLGDHFIRDYHNAKALVKAAETVIFER
jgi:hypothetical protein